jgi:hypothetical protein
VVSTMSAQEPRIDHLSQLAAELRLEIVHFLRKTSDRKSLSLVSKEWKNVVLPELSKRIQTDLVERQVSGRRSAPTTLCSQKGTYNQ